MIIQADVSQELSKGPIKDSLWGKKHHSNNSGWAQFACSYKSSWAKMLPLHHANRTVRHDGGYRLLESGTPNKHCRRWSPCRELVPWKTASSYGSLRCFIVWPPPLSFLLTYILTSQDFSWLQNGQVNCVSRFPVIFFLGAVFSWTFCGPFTAACLQGEE